MADKARLCIFLLLFMPIPLSSKIPQPKYSVILSFTKLCVNKDLFFFYYMGRYKRPLVVGLIDRRRHKPGQKLLPFLLWTPPIIAVIVLLMFIDFSLTQSQTILLTLILFLLYDTFFSLQDISIWGMAALSSPDSMERGRVIQWISILAGAGRCSRRSYSSEYSSDIHKYEGYRSPCTSLKLN